MDLNLEQSKLIEAEPNGYALIKGIAGSGKTTIALHRALFLHRNFCFGPEERVLLATFNRTLINYLQCIFEDVKEKHDGLYANIFSSNVGNVDIQTVDQIIFHYYNEHLAEPGFSPLYDQKIVTQLLTESIRNLPDEYKDLSVLFDHNFVLDEIMWLKACRYLDIEEYQQVDRIGRTKTTSDDSPQRLPKNSPVRRGVFEIMQNFDKLTHKKGLIHNRDMANKVIEHAQANPPNRYKHIIIDEGQDLTRVQLEFLQTIYNEVKGSSFTFIADVAQSIYSTAWLVKGRSFASVGIDIHGRSNALSKNYRTSTQIAQAAYSLIEKDPQITENENYVSPALLDRQGEYPVIRSFSSDAEEADHVFREISRLLDNGYSYKDIAIIARMRKQLDSVKACLDKRGLPSVIVTSDKESFIQDSIRLLSMHAIKGLEFPVVFIVGLNEGVIPFEPSMYNNQDYLETNERKLFYVGMTRAIDKLYLSYWGKPSRYIKDLNPDYLALRNGSKLRPFYLVGKQEYHCAEKVRNNYSAEEEVRQWFINELKQTYFYPEDLIDIEVKVNLFSKPGSIDIVVNINQDGKHTPFIIIETKAPGLRLNEGLEQLKSYMAACQSAQFGVLTNGNTFYVLNSKHELLGDLPLYHQVMMPTEGARYTYLDLRSKEHFSMRMDSDNRDRIIVKDDSQQGVYQDCQALKVPLYEKVAAGSPHLMNEFADEYFCLPSEWYQRQEEIFVIKVKGDSMKEVDICDGDLVVVEKRDHAQNRDIVVVALNEESVIKRYTVMGDSVLLISENEAYEPIHIKTEQAKVLGIALGVVKSNPG